MNHEKERAYSSDPGMESVDHTDAESAGDHSVSGISTSFEDVNGDSRAGSNFLKKPPNVEL
jgi:hypothetical protein